MGWALKFRGKFALILFLIQISLIILFFFFVDYGDSAKPTVDNPDEATRKTKYDDHYLPIFSNIHALVFFGIGFLLTFIRKYGYTGLSMNMLLCAVSIQIALLMQNIWHVEHGMIKVDFESVIFAEFAAVSVVIALGGVFGKVSGVQMLVFAVLETLFYIANEHLSLGFLQVADAGEAVCLHMYAAAFGLSVAFVVDRNKTVQGNPNERTSYNSNIFCMLGTIFLFTMWPCFNAALASGDTQQRSTINTFLALLASCVTAFAASSYVDKEQKFTMTHIQNSTLAGGVAIGCVCNLLVTPAGALAIGAAAGVISVFGYIHATPFLAKNLKIYDPCGINSLHGIPGIFSGITGAIVAATATEATYGDALYTFYPAMKPGAETVAAVNITKMDLFADFDVMSDVDYVRTPFKQAGYQLLYVIVTLVSASVSGLITGLILRLPFFEPLEEEEEMYTDEIFWEIPKSKIIDDYTCSKVSNSSSIY